MFHALRILFPHKIANLTGCEPSFNPEPTVAGACRANGENTGYQVEKRGVRMSHSCQKNGSYQPVHSINNKAVAVGSGLNETNAVPAANLGSILYWQVAIIRRFIYCLSG